MSIVKKKKLIHMSTDVRLCRPVPGPPGVANATSRRTLKAQFNQQQSGKSPASSLTTAASDSTTSAQKLGSVELFQDFAFFEASARHLGLLV
jgi:hypothetical protein